ncbi:MAG TPA: PDZ domain-containing protein [Pyrinomonadaceae bacterium]
MRRTRLSLLLAAFCCLCGAAAAAAQTGRVRHEPLGELRRQAFLGVTLDPPNADRAGAEVRRVADADAAAQAGLRPGDRILRVNGALIDSPAALERALISLRGGDTTRFEIVRGGQLLSHTGTLRPLPREQLQGVETVYDSALTDLGFRVRTIVTRPRNAPGKLPAVFLVGWLSCDSVEYPSGPGEDGFARLLHDIATQSGHVLVRMDKPGVGDSEGPGCSETDFRTELAAYRAAFRTLKRYDFVDQGRVFILGLSNGGGFAPLVPQEEQVRGYVVAGGWSKTWFEHMLEHERRRLTLGGKKPGEVTDAMRGYAEFYTDYLRRKMTPREVLQSKPHLAPLWYEGPEHQYGRPASFFQQLDDLNLAAAWEKVEAPVLVMHGEYDWIMSRDDHRLIADIVNGRQAGRARFVELPKTDHLFITFESMPKAFEGAAGRYHNAVTEHILTFLRQNR